jgi:hypothetical protein
MSPFQKAILLEIYRHTGNGAAADGIERRLSWHGSALNGLKRRGLVRLIVVTSEWHQCIGGTMRRIRTTMTHRYALTGEGRKAASTLWKAAL